MNLLPLLLVKKTRLENISESLTSLSYLEGAEVVTADSVSCEEEAVEPEIAG